MDESGRARNLLDGVTLDDDLVLVVVGLLGDATLKHLDLTNTTLSKKVTDFNKVVRSLVGDGNVHRKVIEGSTNLVLEALGNTNNHVLDVGGDSTEAGDFQTVTEPHVNTEELLADKGGGKRVVGELAGEGTAGSSDSHGLGTESDLDYK